MRKKELIEKYVAAREEIATLKMESNARATEIDSLGRQLVNLKAVCDKYKKQASEAKDHVDKVLEDYKKYETNKIKLNAVMGEDDDDSDSIQVTDFVGSL